jgi:LysR family transcriptional regulator, glycine cleavage system transcriptional activator
LGERRNKRRFLDNSAKLIHQYRVQRPSVTLSTLRGFEAAARLASFALAANELHLSHSAVSHQIKLLEAELGQPLFRRVGRSVVLTDAGKDFARSVRDILQRIEDGVARLAPYQKPGGIIVYTTPAFAKGFILPRMAQLRVASPDVDLWLDTSERKVDFQTDEVDILITQASGVAAHGAIDSHLIDDTRAPLASPALIERMGGLPAGGSSIENWPLLHDESQITWREWFVRAGCPSVDTISGSNFSDHALMIDSAAAGHGVALGSLICAAPYLRSGALQVLEGPSFVEPAYRIYCDLRTYDDDQVRRVYDWFTQEAAV